MSIESTSSPREIKEYLGSLFIPKGKKSVGKALLLIEFINSIPDKASVYLVGHKRSIKYFNEDQLDSNVFYLKTLGELISVKFKKRQTNYSIFGGSSPITVKGEIQRMDINQAIRIPPKKTLESTKVIAQLTPICFLQHDLDWFFYHAIKNHDKLKEVRQEYTYDLSSLGYNCKLSPWLLSMTQQESLRKTFEGINVLIFDLGKNIRCEKALQQIKPNLEVLLNILSFIDNRSHSISHLKVEAEIKGINYSFEEWVKPINLTKYCATSNFNGVDYLYTVECIYKSISQMSASHRHKIFVAFRRFRAAAAQPDLSIKIALYHVVLVFQLKVLLGNVKIELKNQRWLRRTLSNLGVTYDDTDIISIDRFNQDRNKIFKESEPNFDYSKEVFDRMNRITILIGRLFSKIFASDETGQKVTTEMVSHYHFLHLE